MQRQSKGEPSPAVGRLGKVWLVGAGPGEPDLITLRGLRLLSLADVVLYDALSHPGLLELCPQAELVDVGKRYGQRATPQPEITELLLTLAREGKRIVRLKGGDPLIFARGAEEALALREAGIPFEIVPGISSPIAAAAFAGLSLTHRDLSSSVTFITGSDREGKDWSPDAWQKLATATGTICVLMGMRRIAAITQAIIDGGRAESTPAAVIRWAARPVQQTVVGTLGDIAEKSRQAGLASPAIIVVGEIVALREKLSWYEKKPLFGRRILVARPTEQARDTIEEIRDRGAIAELAPAIQIEPPRDPQALLQAALRLSSYDWVVFTSQNGVHKTLAALRTQGRDARAFGNAKIAVIGPRTAQAFRSWGLIPDLVATKFVAESLAADLLRTWAAEGRDRAPTFLLLRAEEARDVLPDTLRGAGASVDVVAAYQTRAVTGEARQKLVEAIRMRSDVVLLTSSSMVSSLCAALGEDAAKLLSEKCVVAIGPITARTCADAGIAVDVEAAEHTVSGALDALEASEGGG